MKVKELMEMLSDGVHPSVQFTEVVNSIVQSTRPDPNMRGKLLGVQADDEAYGIYLFKVDFAPWEPYNREVATHEWFNPKTNTYDLTIFETEFYPADGIMTFTSAVDSENDGEVGILELIPNTSLELYEKYKKSGSVMGYVRWLESQLTPQLANGKKIDVSLASLWNHFAATFEGPEEPLRFFTKYGHVLEKLSDGGLGNDRDFIDLRSANNGNTICCDGEECEVIQVAEDKVMLMGEDHYTFVLSKEEADYAIFFDREVLYLKHPDKELPPVGTKEIREYAQERGNEAAENLLLLLGPDGFNGSSSAYKELESELSLE